ncbi:hypothetical protein CONLIGDRAFT_715454 [Coniochaeta ligniaria NRRL 30616]|uniref:Metallo-beta-lactamase domain-containing protein n=1 Tax=Coniochaeta ligniaria NRRL 30616 TaxID=1408157 RepID=A0A1J7IPB6_9PEZI|nr:hypothetical protein CONLIGDRAFT_715454 [Coniochaeta ligniaria NRRL 30616]
MASSTTTKPPVYVTMSALDAGHLTLPENLFVTDADPTKRATVPSLSFLIQHPSPPSSRPGNSTTTTTNLLFDLGIKRDLTSYAPAQAAHIAQRHPIIVDPDCAASLRNGTTENPQAADSAPLLDPSTEINLILLSHVHWDHVGTPSDFPSATFLVGSGTLSLLRHGAGPLYPADTFNSDEIPASRTVEFPPVSRPDGVYASSEPRHTPSPASARENLPPAAGGWGWQSLAGFPNALDLFGDGSVWVADAPGHLYGHVNLLCRTGPGRWVYLGGDCCHDPRILRGEKGFALYDDGKGGKRSVHVHTGVAKDTLDRIGEFVKMRGLEKGEEGDGEVQVEVVVAHDAEWREGNRHRFWPGRM